MSKTLFGKFSQGDIVKDISSGYFGGLIGKIVKTIPQTLVSPQLYIIKPTSLELINSINPLASLFNNPAKVNIQLIQNYLSEHNIGFTDDELELVASVDTSAKECIFLRDTLGNKFNLNVKTGMLEKPTLIHNNKNSFEEFFGENIVNKNNVVTQQPQNKMIYNPTTPSNVNIQDVIDNTNIQSAKLVGSIVGKAVTGTMKLIEPKTFNITSGEMLEKIEYVDYVTRVTLKDGSIGKAYFNPDDGNFDMELGKKIAYLRAKGKSLDPEKQAIKDHIATLQQSLLDLENYEKIAKTTINSLL